MCRSLRLPHEFLLSRLLPVGISFYTFQIISYYVDVYRGEVAAEHNFVDFAAYVTMFPQLIAGPIVRFQSVQAELKHREITWEKTGEGAARFVCGLCKKVLIADSLAPLVSALQNISEKAAKTEAVDNRNSCGRRRDRHTGLLGACPCVYVTALL